MRLAILNSGHSFGTKVLFAFIRMVSRLPVPDAVKLFRYRSDFYGMRWGVVAQQAMRGPSAWSVGDRELMGAFVSKMNECECCMKTHAGVAAVAYQDQAKVSAALSSLEPAAIGRATSGNDGHAAQADAPACRGCGRHARRAGCRRLARADRGRARGLLYLQHGRSAVPHPRVLRAESQGL